MPPPVPSPNKAQNRRSFTAEQQKALDNALGQAAKFKNSELVLHCLESGSNPNAMMRENHNSTEMPAFHFACQNIGLADGVGEAFLRHGVNIDCVDADGQSALFKAVKRRSVADIGYLLDKGADVNLRDKKGETALFTALRDVEFPPVLLKLLLQKGADPLAQSETGHVALNIALQQRSSFDRNEKRERDTFEALVKALPQAFNAAAAEEKLKIKTQRDVPVLRTGEPKKPEGPKPLI